MLKFSRNKLVSVEQKDQNTLIAHGILDDDIYSINLDVSFGIPDLKIISVQGKWKRWTTPECPRAIQFLQESIGLSVREPDFGQKIFKLIGRKACRHFANLLLECSHSAKEALTIVKWHEAKKENPQLALETYIENLPEKSTSKAPIKPSKGRQASGLTEKVSDRNAYKKIPGQMLIDLHVHTFPASQCSSAPVDDLIEEAKKIGLDAICLTDHNFVWPKDQVKRLQQKHDFPIFRGNEITTNQGDIIVFGLDKNIQGIINIEELREEVTKADGFMIAAHPFRGFLIVGVEQTGLTTDEALKRPLFDFVDAVEVMNGKVTKNENNFASKVANSLKLPATGGSDAHEITEVGRFATRFYDEIKNERELIHALKKGNYSLEDIQKVKG